MSLKKPVVRINVKINVYFFFECGLQLLLQVVNKFCYPTVIFIVFLTIADENIIFETGDET